MKTKTISIAALFLTVLAMNSCRKDYRYIPKPVPPPVGVKFSTDIVPFFSAKCVAGCHTSGGAFDGLHLTSSEAYTQLWTAGTNAPYIDTVNDANSLLYVKIALPNPPGIMNNYATITPEERAKVLSWIQDGAKNN